MSEKPEDRKAEQEKKKFMKFVGGCVLVVAGITMILMWFEDLMTILRGGVGFLTALGGMLLLYSLKD